MTKALSTFELQSAIVAAARASGRPVLDAGRGQPNWLATEPRAAFFTLGHFAVGEALEASPSPAGGRLPDHDGVADRLIDSVVTGQQGGALLAEAIEYCGQRVRPRARCAGPRAGARRARCRVPVAAADAGPRRAHHAALPADGHRQPVRTSRHVPRLRHRGRRGRRWPTCSGRCARTRCSDPGDKIAIATPIFTPYLQIPVLAGLRLRRRRAAVRGAAPDRFGEEILRAAARSGDQGLLHHQPRQPRQQGAAAGPAGAAARAGDRGPAGPDHRRRHRLRHVRRGVPRDDDRAAAQRHHAALVLEELRRHRDPLGFIAVHHDNVARRAAAGRRTTSTRAAQQRPLRVDDVRRRQAARSSTASSPTAARWRCTTSPAWPPRARCRWRCSRWPTCCREDGPTSKRRGRSCASRLEALIGTARRAADGRAGQLLLRPDRPARGRRGAARVPSSPGRSRRRRGRRMWRCGWPPSTGSSCCPACCSAPPAGRSGCPSRHWTPEQLQAVGEAIVSVLTSA